MQRVRCPCSAESAAVRALVPMARVIELVPWSPCCPIASSTVTTGWVAKPCHRHRRRAGCEDELGGRTGGDGERGAGRAGEPGRGRGQRVAACLAGDLAAGEGGHAAGGGQRVGGAGQRAAGVGPDGEGDRCSWPWSTTLPRRPRRSLRAGCSRRPVGPAAGLGGEDELGGGADRDGERRAGRRGQPGRGADRV